MRELNKAKIVTMNDKLNCRFDVSDCRTLEIEKHSLLKNMATVNKKTVHKKIQTIEIIRNA